MTMTFLSFPPHTVSLGYQPGSCGRQRQSRPLCGGERWLGAAGHQRVLHPQVAEPHLWRVRLGPGLGNGEQLCHPALWLSLRQLMWCGGMDRSCWVPSHPYPSQDHLLGCGSVLITLSPGQGPRAQHLSPCWARVDRGCVWSWPRGFWWPHQRDPHWSGKPIL